MQQKQDYSKSYVGTGGKKVFQKRIFDKNLATQCAKLQKKIYTPLRRWKTISENL